MSDGRCPGMVAFDVDRIKDFVFATHRPVDATGASSLVKGLDDVRGMLGSVGGGFSVVYACGGSGLLWLEDFEQAGRIARAIETAYRRQTITGSCTAVAERCPSGPIGDGFQAALKRLGTRLQKRKGEKAGEEAPEAWTEPQAPAAGVLPAAEQGALVRCGACAAWPAVAFDTLQQEEDNTGEPLCESCQRKRELGRREKQGSAHTLGDIASGAASGGDGRVADTQGRIAVLYADLDRAGGLLQQCGSIDEVRRLSAHLLSATVGAVASIAERYPGRHQAPVVGGDDAVLFIPVRSVAETDAGGVTCLDELCALVGGMEKALRAVPPELLGRPIGDALTECTVSAGLLVADHHLPMPFLFDMAMALVASAKRLSYARRESSVDYMLLKGGTPLSSTIETARDRGLLRSFDGPVALPWLDGAPEVQEVLLTRRPYGLTAFRDLVAVSRECRGAAGSTKQAFLRMAVEHMTNDHPAEIGLNVRYDQARRRSRGSGEDPWPEECLLWTLDEPEPDEPPVLSTGALDVLELIEIEKSGEVDRV